MHYRWHFTAPQHPVHIPSWKFDLAIKAAKAIGLAIPESFLLRADAVFE